MYSIDMYYIYNMICIICMNMDIYKYKYEGIMNMKERKKREEIEVYIQGDMKLK